MTVAPDPDVVGTTAVVDVDASAKNTAGIHRVRDAAVVDVKFSVGADRGGDRGRARVQRHVVAGVGHRAAEGVRDKRDLGFGVVPHIAAVFLGGKSRPAARDIQISLGIDGGVAGDAVLLHIHAVDELGTGRDLSRRYDDCGHVINLPFWFWNSIWSVNCLKSSSVPYYSTRALGRGSSAARRRPGIHGVDTIRLFMTLSFRFRFRFQSAFLRDSEFSAFTNL